MQRQWKWCFSLIYILNASFRFRLFLYARAHTQIRWSSYLLIRITAWTAVSAFSTVITMLAHPTLMTLFTSITWISFLRWLLTKMLTFVLKTHWSLNSSPAYNSLNWINHFRYDVKIIWFIVITISIFRFKTFRRSLLNLLIDVLIKRLSIKGLSTLYKGISL